LRATPSIAGMALRIEDYALIGDCETAALVGRDGSIDWMCLPRFDSDACFSSLLGTPDHGRWLLAPKKTEDVKITRRYRPHTLILETRFETDEGAATLIDFMPGQHNGSSLVRLVVGERGRVTFCCELIVRFGYGASVPWVSRLDDGTLRAIAGPDMLILRTPAKLRGENFRTLSQFTVAQGDMVPFSLSYLASHLPIPKPVDPLQQLKETERFWTEWCAKADIAGPWTAQVERSLLTLKALTFVTTGGIVAAPTTSLPERIGGERNWDYRFCWLRDATLTLLALIDAGFHEEAQAWRDWLIRAAAGRPDQLQIMYGIAGERRLTEWKVPWLPGYERSRPVRIGNAAHRQLQLDVYGELMDTLHQARRSGLAPKESGWALQLAALRQLEQSWRQPDQGIWEIRGHRQHFVYSKVMAWVAYDRALKSAEMFDLKGPIDRWKALCSEIREDVEARGFDTELNSFVQAYGAKQLDASLLLLPCVGFLPPDDPRIRGTVAAIEDTLIVDGFVQRYDTRTSDDGLVPGEGIFLACSFWLVDAYLLLGRRSEAEALFERLLGLCNDVGLLSEEYDPKARRMLGNFPQALSHLALVNSAFNLWQPKKPAKQRAETDADTAR
jgi:GH15 family glucan-1,4-alpha-glucosidase